MNITFTKEELVKFCNDICDWNEKAMAYLLKELSSNPHALEMGNGLQFIQQKIEKFKEQNPQPTWRNLL